MAPSRLAPIQEEPLEDALGNVSITDSKLYSIMILLGYNSPHFLVDRQAYSVVVK